jgi:hypothetical protein
LTYQISRSGQIYGPYTLDDLKRYLASGNVLLTDLAKSDAMADWIPVSQLLAANGTPSEPPAVPPAYEPVQPTPNPAAYTSPYPAAAVPIIDPALGASPYPDPPSLHWALVALFSLLTCGVFMPVWNLIVSAWLKRVQPNAVALFYYIAAYVLVFLVWLTPGSSSHHVFMPGVPSFHYGTNWVGGLLLAIHWVLKLIARFSEQASLEEHFNGPEPIGLTLNPVMTFFFGGLYFQYHLSRIHTLKQAARFGMGAPYRF